MATNVLRLMDYNAAYYKRNAARLRQKAKEFFHCNKAQLPKSTGRVAKWRAENPEKSKKLREVEKLSAKQNPRIRSKIAARQRERRASDLGHWLAGVLRCRINIALRKSGALKSAKTCNLIGCDIPALRAHLEALFLPGMSWENRREWHIDHIKPCVRFDLAQGDQQRECFHFSNLRPLWAGDNLRKGAK